MLADMWCFNYTDSLMELTQENRFLQLRTPGSIRELMSSAVVWT